MKKAKILFYDIEILPRHFNTCFGADRSTLCTFGYKWGTDSKARYLDLLHFPDSWEKSPFAEEELVHAAHKIMIQADQCVHHYGDKFDFKYMNTKFLLLGLDPLTIRDVDLFDTWKGSKYNLKLSNNRMDTIARYFGLKPKDENEVGWWFDTIARDPKALRKISKYCAGDVETLHQVAMKLNPITPTKRRLCGPDLNLCPECGSVRWENKQKYTTAAGYVTMVLRCKDCRKTWTMPEAKYLALRSI